MKQSKFLSFLAALALTAATLATPSALGYGASTETDDAYGFAVNADSPTDAMNEAVNDCVNNKNGNRADCEANLVVRDNQCLVIRNTTTGFDVGGFNDSIASGINALASECNGFLFDCLMTDGTPITKGDVAAISVIIEAMQEDRDSCDSTCDGDNVPMDEPNLPGCRPAANHTDCGIAGDRDGNNRIYFNQEDSTCRPAANADECVEVATEVGHERTFFNEGDSTCYAAEVCVGDFVSNAEGRCRAVEDSDDCAIAALRDGNTKNYIDETGAACRVAESCEGNNEFQNNGSCTICPGNAEASEDNKSCVCTRNAPQNTQIYDSARNICTNCPANTTANADSNVCICEGNYVLNDADICTACPADLPIADEIMGECRQPLRNIECASLNTATPIYDSEVLGVCRAREHGDCDAGMVADGRTNTCALPNTSPECQVVSDAAAEGDDAKNKTIYDSGNGNCRLPTAADCAASANTPILEGEVCRAATDVMECINITPNTPVFNNGRCLPVETKSSAIGKPILLGVSALAVWFFYTAYVTDAGAISWTPSYAFNNNNGNVSYSVGSRWSAAADNWRFYWQTAHGNADGGLDYGSGMHYNSGIFSAKFDSIGNSETADWDLSLSAQKTSGLWHVGGGYNFGLQLSAEDETDTQNHVNIAARYSLDKWLLSATANTDGDTTAAKVNYSYRF